MSVWPPACLFLFPRVEWHNVPFGCRSSRLGLLLHVQPLPSTGCLVMPMVNLFMCLFVYLQRVSGRRPLRLGLLLHHRQQIFGDLWFSFFRLANGKIYLNINVVEMWQTIRKLIGGEEEAGKTWLKRFICPFVFLSRPRWSWTQLGASQSATARNGRRKEFRLLVIRFYLNGTTFSGLGPVNSHFAITLWNALTSRDILAQMIYNRFVAYFRPRRRSSFGDASIRKTYD